MVEAEVASLSPAIGDELTGLSSRRGFEMLDERLCGAAGGLDLDLAVIYVDLDNMKAINDTWGHGSGDQALIDRGRGGAGLSALVEGPSPPRNASAERPWELSISLGLAERRAGAAAELWGLVAEADARS